MSYSVSAETYLVEQLYFSVILLILHRSESFCTTAIVKPGEPGLMPFHQALRRTIIKLN